MTASHHSDPCLISGQSTRFCFDPDCGIIRDLALCDQGRWLRPMHKVPWIGEDLPAGLSPHTRRMEGDFFCAPFSTGGGSAPVLHGWPANALWQVEQRDGSSLRARLSRDVQGAHVTKRLQIRDGHPFLYQTHLFEGGAGGISVANHAMVTLPGGGLINTSPKASYRTPAVPQESDPSRGRSALAYPAQAADPGCFPAADGGSIDLTRYPYRPRHEDFVVATEAADSALGWTAVVRLGQGDVYLSLRNPRQLPMTMFWHSEGGRDYAPWSGRHRHCLGVEEGFAPEVLGEPAGLTLASGLDIRHVIGCISWPSETRVREITAGADHLTILGENGDSRQVPFDRGHLML